MKLKFVLCMFVLLTFILSVTCTPARCEQQETAGTPRIALILAKPAHNDLTKNGTDKNAPAAVEGTEMPAQDDASDDIPAINGIDEGARTEVEDAEITVKETALDHFNRGVAHDKSGMYSEAITSYKKAISIKPDYAEAYYNLAFSCLLSNDVEAAHDEYMLLIDINPQMAEDLYSKALIMVRSNPENKFAVQVGAFRKIQNADNMLDKIKANYMHARIESEDGYSKVRLFGMKNKEEAEIMIKDIRDKFKVAPFIVTVH